MNLLNSLGAQPERFTCSRAGCAAAATTMIIWRNPKIHTEDRHKTWLSCAEHLDYLEGFLSSRGFPVRLEPVNDSPTTERGEQ
ncbi:MAG: hypothetical protein ACTJHU_08730 [Mycetocola sp.]